MHKSNPSPDYPQDALFDILTLVNEAQPSSILLLGDIDPAFLNEYVEQRSLLGQPCSVEALRSDKALNLDQSEQIFDLGIALHLFEKLTSKQGGKILARLRDVSTRQFCICLPLSNDSNASHGWSLTDLLGYALNRVAVYQADSDTIGLFKYSIAQYKKRPSWLNADNWANPDNWGKYRW